MTPSNNGIVDSDIPGTVIFTCLLFVSRCVIQRACDGLIHHLKVFYSLPHYSLLKKKSEESLGRETRVEKILLLNFKLHFNINTSHSESTKAHTTVNVMRRL